MGFFGRKSDKEKKAAGNQAVKEPPAADDVSDLVDPLRMASAPGPAIKTAPPKPAAAPAAGKPPAPPATAKAPASPAPPKVAVAPQSAPAPATAPKPASVPAMPPKSAAPLAAAPKPSAPQPIAPPVAAPKPSARQPIAPQAAAPKPVAPAAPAMAPAPKPAPAAIGAVRKAPPSSPAPMPATAKTAVPQSSAPLQSAPKAAAPKPATAKQPQVPEGEQATYSGPSKQITKLISEIEAAGLVDKSKLAALKMRVNEAEAGEHPAAAGSLMAETELVSEADMLQAIANSIGMECVSLKRNLDIPPEVLAEIDIKVAKAYHIFPLESTPETLTVAVADPLDVRITDELGLRLGKQIIAKLAPENEIGFAIRNYYEGDRMTQIIQSTIQEETQRREDEVASGDADDFDASADTKVIDLDADAPEDEVAVVKFVNLLFREAIHERASDIHIEPTRFSVTIRFRIDGVLQEMPSPPKKWQNMIISRLKVMSGMDLAEKRVPQDGRIQLTVQARALDLRVSCLPSIYGEALVLRILDQSSVMLGLVDVGFLPDNIEKFNTLIKSPNGIILMTGPTGSGKTTTLYAALNVLNTPDTKIITIEDPVEYQVQGINQMQVNKDLGLDFAMGLRTVLRQSPDIILVGEIRDEETAGAAIRAALTGHLVFSTLHTNDAPGSTIRLIDMGIKPFLIASALEAAIGQRLIRRICSSCKTPYTYKAQEIASVGVDPKDFIDREYAIGRGCGRCSNTGYRGRTAIHEIFIMNPELRQMVIRRESGSRIKAAAIRNGMRTLRMDGWEKILMGQSTVEEVMRITAMD